MMRSLMLLLTLALAGAAPGAPLGRLFTSPAERAQLDAVREAGAAARAPDAAPAPSEPPPQISPQAPPQPVVLNGIVRRSGGKGTAWLNQAPQDDTALPGAARPAFPLRLPSGRDVSLRPGQRYDPVEDKIKDVNEP